MAIPNENKQRLIDSIVNSQGKWKKPFTKGELAVFNILGGDWNQYAEVVLSITIADTLLSIDRKLDRLLESTSAGPGGS